MAPRPLVDLDSLVAGVREGNRGMLARAITMVESRKPEHRSLAQQLLLRLLDNDSQAVRVGITGVPGVGKSTFIEALGSRLTGAGHRVAVLAVDPSSPRTGGSIMGDKTRMAKLSVDPDAFVRPSPTAGSLGGVARATRETMVVVEAAGYDVVLVETVGVGQSEATVAQMVDCFTVLSLARTGDSLQGIKKGVLELAEVVAINKADGEHLPEARVAARDLSQAIHLITPKDALWRPPVLTCSAVTGDGVGEFWDTVLEHRKTMTDAGELAARRARQQVDWTWAMVHDEVASRMQTDAAVAGVARAATEQVAAGELTATLAAQRILDAFFAGVN